MTSRSEDPSEIERRRQRAKAEWKRIQSENEARRRQRERERAEERERRAAEIKQKIAENDKLHIQARREWQEREQKREQKRVAALLAARMKAWREFYSRRTLDEIDVMTGLEFEAFLARLLHAIGCRDIELTRRAADHGADLVCRWYDGRKAVVQAKRSRSTIGNTVLGEVYRGMRYYGATLGVILTNSSFSSHAKDAASKDESLLLLDRSWLQEQIVNAFPDRVPPFDDDVFENIVGPFIEATTREVDSRRGSSSRAKPRGIRRRPRRRRRRR